MKITLTYPDPINGIFGIGPENNKLSVGFNNKRVYGIFQKMDKDLIEGSIWEGDIEYNDSGEMIFEIRAFLKHRNR